MIFEIGKVYTKFWTKILHNAPQKSIFSPLAKIFCPFPRLHPYTLPTLSTHTPKKVKTSHIDLSWDNFDSGQLGKIPQLTSKRAIWVCWLSRKIQHIPTQTPLPGNCVMTSVFRMALSIPFQHAHKYPSPLQQALHNGQPSQSTS